MSYRCLVSAVFGVAAAAILSIPASAQGMDRKDIVANIEFKFYVGEVAFPAGAYTFSATNFGADDATIHPSGSQNTQTMPVITRLTHQEGLAQSATSSLVFDNSGGRMFLSEIWIGGRQGYLVRGRTAGHQDVAVNLIK